MEKDYYIILELKKTATEEELRNQYKKLALKYHPDKNEQAPWAVKKFQEIQVAYEALLKILSSKSGNREEKNQPKVQDPPVFHDVHVTLEEIYSGCTKTFKLTRLVHHENGHRKKEDAFYSVEVKRGWKDGTKVTFSQAGDRHPDRIPADVVFVVREKPHPRLTRQGNDLFLTFKVEPSNTNRVNCEIETIDNHFINCSVNFGEKNMYFHERGLPDQKNPNIFGGLQVNFDWSNWSKDFIINSLENKMKIMTVTRNTQCAVNNGILESNNNPLSRNNGVIEDNFATRVSCLWV